MSSTEPAPQPPGSRIMTFTPSKEEFKDFSRYIAHMESRGAHKAGMAKVIPPKDWKPRGTYDDIDDLVIPAPIQQVVSGQSGLFTQYNIQKKPMTVREFRKMANTDKFCNPRYIDFDELERKFWKNLTFNPPLYGADISGTLYDPDVAEWNIGHLNTILDTVENESGIKIKGVNTPYLYFGMWKSTFAWHTEDMDLYSINYLHFGEPKSWYVVPPEHGKRLERLAKGFFPGNAQSCEAFLRHKMTLISPSILKKYGIPFEKVTQEAGQFIVTFPFAYHAGFNHGYNCAESTNFATQRWIDYGKQATLCSCRQDMVKISMDVFVRKFQPDRYKLWKAGKDNAPIDHAKLLPLEAAEFLKAEKPESVRQEAGEAVVDDAGGKSPNDEEIPKLQIGAKRKHAAVEKMGNSEQNEKQAEEVELKKAKMTQKEPLAKAPVKPNKESLQPKPEPKKNKHFKPPLPKLQAKPQPKPQPKPQLKPQPKPQLKPQPKPHPKPQPKLQPKPQPKLQLKPQSKPQSKPQPKLQLKPQSKPQSKPQPKLQLKPQSKPQSKPQPKLQLKPQSKPQSKPQLKAKKTTNRRSPAKKEQRNSISDTETGPPEPTAQPPGPAPLPDPDEEEDTKPVGSSSPAHRLFQRTLSPADVLHVHSYAKGDYGEGEAPTKEERKSDDSSDSDTEEQRNSRFVQQRAEEVSGAAQSAESLGKLPGHHPLIKDGMSDEELLEELPVEQDGLGEAWAKPLFHLWQSRPPNLKKEKEYNRRMSLQAPYCSICLLFYTHQRTECVNSADSPVMLPGGRMRTKPLIPETCFTTTTEEDSEGDEQPPTPHLEEDGTSLLISCSHCCVRMHSSCYGVDPATVTKDWKCVRCKANAMTENCCLCSLRGGALQKANNNKWVHVMCAVAVLEARFVNIGERSPVDLSGIPLQRFKLKCYYCKKRMKKASGCCVQCSHGRCPTAYHPTCAQAAGVLMQPDEWPFVVYVTCCRHKGPTQTERNKAAMHELTVGQKVICKHKNGRYYQCDVVQLSKETFYEVNFDDGSFSDNLFPEDIVSRDCAQLGPPPQSEVVQVRWTDGIVYGAKFVAAHVIQMYLVEFEDGSQLTAKRDDVYALDEELPKRVKSRLSKASDMRFDGIFDKKEIIQESKRQRVINSRYRGDFIEPVIYRAIME